MTPLSELEKELVLEGRFQFFIHCLGYAKLIGHKVTTRQREQYHTPPAWALTVIFEI